MRPFRSGLGVELERIQYVLDHPAHEKDVRFLVGIHRLVYYRDFTEDYNSDESAMADKIISKYVHLLNFEVLTRTARKK